MPRLPPGYLRFSLLCHRPDGRDDARQSIEFVGVHANQSFADAVPSELSYRDHAAHGSLRAVELFGGELERS